MMDISTTHEKVLNACFRLNAEAYEHQVLANKGKPLKQFTPCAKAEELMAHIRTGKHFGTCHVIAARTICACHNSLSDNGLMEYEYDCTYREAHYRGDTKTLYPKLWRGA